MLEEATGLDVESKCGLTARVLLECGRTTLICTISPHEDHNHFDEAFNIGWVDIESPQAD
jgi:ribonuclease PH